MQVRRHLFQALVAVSWLAGTSSSPATRPLTFQVLGDDPTRPHLLKPDSFTTFVLFVRNESTSRLDMQISIQPTVLGWSSDLSTATYGNPGVRSPSLSISLNPQEATTIVAFVTAPANSADGAQAGAVIAAVSEGRTIATTEVRAKVRNQPKIYFVAIDGCGSGYLKLDRKGRNCTGANCDWLMPRTLQFANESAHLPSAKALLPAQTDPNHMAALTGLWPGSLGILSVNSFYSSVNSQNQAVFLTASRDLLRTGVNGTPVLTLFEIIRNHPAVGSREMYTLFFSGKETAGHFLRDGASSSVSRLGGGRERPPYLEAPKVYRLGDPPSDPDALLDREGINVVPPIKTVPMAQAEGIMNNPAWFPADRWMAESAAKIILTEDPDISYFLLAGCDDVQHLFGAADYPIEWSDPGTPNVLWDDVNVFNKYANRDPVLDEIYESDLSFGLILDTLRSKGTYDDSIIVLLSDHGQVTMLSEGFLDLGSMLINAGVKQDEVEFYQTGGDVGYLHLKKPERGPAIERALESYSAIHPVHGRRIRPLVVLNRSEMDSGIDSVWGRITNDTVAGDRRGDLYSDWCINGQNAGRPKVRWPDLWILTRERFGFINLQTTVLQPGAWGGALAGPFIGWHTSPATTLVPLIIHGPRFQPGVYTQTATLADIAPTLYQSLGISLPPYLDGKVISGIIRP